MTKLIVILLTVVAISIAWLLSFRWQLCTGAFHNYEGEHPVQTTFLLDRCTGKVWYAAPKSLDHCITPDFKPVFIDKSRPS